MASSDPYDDGFFDDPEALLAIVAAEEQALSASQVQPRPPQRYHHQVSAPVARGGPSTAHFGRRKDGSARDPAPLRVQPGTVSGGFGWEHGGKRVADGNVARHLESVEKRQEYWRSEEPRDITVDDSGRYAARPQEEDVVDKRHIPITLAASQARPPPDAKSAQARRQAIAQAARPFARSVSASSHLQLEPSQGAIVRKLHLDLENERKLKEEAERKLEAVPEIGQMDRMEVDVNDHEQERRKEFDALQIKVYQAEGRAATLERNKQKDIARYAAEADKLKHTVDALQLQMQAKEREYKQQLESLRSQAVFNNHAVMNSTVRGRHASQKTASPKIIQPGFKSFVNAFAPSRAKRQRTEDSPIKADPRTPEASPSKPRPGTPVAEEIVPDLKGELLHHLFNCSYFSPGRNEQPILFYILNHRAEALVDPGGEFSRRCAEILKACGNTELDYQGLLSVLADSFAGMLSVFEITLRAGKRDLVICDVLRLMSRTAIRFSGLVEAMVTVEANLGKRLLDIARLANPSELENLGDVGEAICFGGDGRTIWHSMELVDFILLFKEQVDLFYSAACSAKNFHALTAGQADGQVLLDAMSRSLISRKDHRHCELVVRAFSMLAVSDPNGVLLISERTVLVPCLAKTLYRESSRIWGINMEDYSLKDSISLISLILTLLHYIAYPSSLSSSQSDMGQGLNLALCLITATQTKEFNGIHFIFQSALGAMAFAEIDMEFDDLKNIQNLSQDLLEVVAEGPEVDAIYELYAEDEEDDEGVDPEAYAEMDDIQLIEQ